MAKNANDEAWKELLEKFSSYEGTVINYCKENNMTKSQFYYYKKKFMREANPVFHAIKVNNESTLCTRVKNNAKESNNIKIKLGKANIYIPSQDSVLLSVIIKELLKSC